MKQCLLAATCCGSLLWGMATLPAPVYAHGGEDHGEQAAPAAPAPAPVGTGIRLELQSPDVELLGILHDGKLTLYADHFATNEPIPAAKVELESKGQKLTLQTDPNGVAEVEAGWLAQAGHYEITATVQAKGINDLLIGTVTIPPSPLEGEGQGVRGSPWWKFWGSLLENALLPTPAFAHGGEDHSHEEENPAPAALPAPASDKPARLADGSVFLPKPAQHLLGIRTALGKPQAVAQTVQLNGVVVADPNASGQVQPTQSGRLLAPEGGFPAVGASVTQGQALAYLEPASSNIDKGDRAEKVAEVRSQLALAEKNATRLESIASGVIPRVEVDAARNAADTLKARLQALQNTPPQAREVLVAPVSGLVSRADVVAGRQANAGDLLFSIIDPTRLQVEALAYDPSLAGQVTGATAVVAGQTLQLGFIGGSQQLRNQALPLRFSMEEAGKTTPLVVGQPLKLAVQTRTQTQGIPLPASSVVSNSQMEPTVWVHTSAERFAPHPVKVQPLDADTVVVTAGLSGTVRAVTQGTALLQQVR